MPKVNISLNGRNYAVACDEGQESRLLEIGAMIDKKMRDIARAGAARSETYLLVLTSIVLADEILSGKSSGNEKSLDVANSGERQQKIDVAAVEHLTDRIQALADKIAG